jgi:hypothetical protein
MNEEKKNLIKLLTTFIGPGSYSGWMMISLGWMIIAKA